MTTCPACATDQCACYRAGWTTADFILIGRVFNSSILDDLA